MAIVQSHLLLTPMFIAHLKNDPNSFSSMWHFLTLIFIQTVSTRMLWASGQSRIQEVAKLILFEVPLKSLSLKFWWPFFGCCHLFVTFFIQHLLCTYALAPLSLSHTAHLCNNTHGKATLWKKQRWRSRTPLCSALLWPLLWATLWRHSWLSRAAALASASSQVSPNFCRSCLTMPLQFVRGWAGPRLHPGTSQ